MTTTSHYDGFTGPGAENYERYFVPVIQNSGSAYVYTREGDSWTRPKSSLPVTASQALSSDQRDPTRTGPTR